MVYASDEDSLKAKIMMSVSTMGWEGSTAWVADRNWNPITYSVIKSERNSFCGYVVLDSFNTVYASDEKSG